MGPRGFFDEQTQFSIHQQSMLLDGIIFVATATRLDRSQASLNALRSQGGAEAY